MESRSRSQPLRGGKTFLKSSRREREKNSLACVKEREQKIYSSKVGGEKRGKKNRRPTFGEKRKKNEIAAVAEREKEAKLFY